MELKILVACEYSGTIRDAFTELGHYAVSCDLLPTESPGLHYQGNVFDIIYNYWDLVIACPPCQFLSNAGNRYYNLPGRDKSRSAALQFVKDIYNSNKTVCIENPVGFLNDHFMKPTQVIHPYYFGDNVMKRTCLWLKNLPPLHYTKCKDLYCNEVTKLPIPEPITVGTKNRHFTEMARTAKKRSKFFPSIAKAMAHQWSYNFYVI